MNSENERYIFLAQEGSGSPMEHKKESVEGLRRERDQLRDQLKIAHEELKAQEVRRGEIEHQMQRTEKLASLGLLLAGVAHEINNPVSFTLSGAKNMERHLSRLKDFIDDLAMDDADKEILRAFDEQFEPLFQNLHAILDGTERLASIVAELRVFSREENRFSHANLADGLRSTGALVGVNYKEHLEIVFDFQAEPLIGCWPAQLNQVFMNLMINAAQAIVARKKEDTSFGLGQLKLSTWLAGNEFVICIEDNGCGMSEEVKLQMFQAFFTTKSRQNGTGLGMSISREIIEKHQGSIQVESNEGVGTQVFLRLPIHSTLCEGRPENLT